MAKKRILLVDDEPRFTRILKLHLEKTGAYEVRAENAGKMALAAARQFKPDLILLDVVMPDMDGGEVASNISADESLKNIPIVFLTATVAKEEEGIIAGYPFIAKPVTAEEVIKCIEKHLGPIQQLPLSPDLRPRHFIIPTFAIFLIAAGFFGYKLYTQSEQSQQETFKEIQKTRHELSLLRDSAADLRASATHAILMQQKTIDAQGKTLAEQNDSLREQEKKLAEKNLREMKAIEALLEKTLKNIEQTKVSNLRSSGVSGSLLTEFAPSVVKVYCLANTNSNDIQKGSGFLYRAGSRNNLNFPLYYVQTNLHVVETTDGSISRCRIVLYPDYTESNSYLLFKSKSYRSYGKDIDVAYLEPEIVTNYIHAGTLNDLLVYARDETETPVCDSVNIGDHLSILGYPGIGGETLTVTDGIISGFEFVGRNRYVKTSAKTDRGNSGGVAIKDSGCVVGIPTSSRRGRVESLGRILDLNYLFTVTLK